EQHLLLGILLAFKLQQLFLPADRNGIFCAQPVTIGANLGECDRQFRLDLPPRQKEGTPPDRRAEQHHDENRHKNAEYEKESGLDHGFTWARAVSDKHYYS